MRKVDVENIFIRVCQKLNIQKKVYSIYQVVRHKQIEGSVTDSNNLLDTYRTKEIKYNVQHDYNNLPVDLSIIIPVYNVEKYLKKCLDSVLNQRTKYKYEVIIVNDGTLDNSEQIISLYLDNQKVIYIKQKNQGLSCARNAALEKVHGKYLMYVDSDDYISSDAIENLLNKAYTLDADVVEGGYIIHRDEKEIRRKLHENLENVDPLKVLWGYPWGKVIKSKLFENLIFPERMNYEDTIISFLVYPKVKRAATIDKVVYFYRDNAAGISRNTFSGTKSIETFFVFESIVKVLEYYNIQKTQNLYEKVLRQVIVNGYRTQKMDDEVKKSIFICTSELIKEHFSGMHAESYEGKIIESLLEKKEYKNYLYFCKLFY